ncbi:MAG TPA: DedA family protein [Acidimicrobiales bacterium]|nr:DedA family protein [Acidimicrobiales bacterium]
MSIEHLVTTYGYGAVFLLVAAESLGIPLPGETILIAAGTYAGSTHRLSIVLVFLVATVAAILGDNIGYVIGLKGGYRLLLRYGPKVRLDETKVKVGRLIFDRHGPKVVFFGRFVSILRTYAAFLAGTNRMAWRRFLPYNALGGVVWAALYAFGAYAAGSTITKVSGPVAIALGVAAVIAVVAGILVVRRHTGRLSAEAEAAYPGPLT